MGADTSRSAAGLVPISGHAAGKFEWGPLANGTPV